MTMRSPFDGSAEHDALAGHHPIPVQRRHAERRSIRLGTVPYVLGAACLVACAQPFRPAAGDTDDLPGTGPAHVDGQRCDPAAASGTDTDANPSGHQTSFTVDQVSADAISISYRLMPGSHADTTGAMVGIWQNQQVPWDDVPLATQALGPQQSGSVVLQGLTVQANDYVIGLFTGPLRSGEQHNGNCAAQALLDIPANTTTYDSDTVRVVSVGTTSLAVWFACLPGYRAATNKAWLGLWRGATADRDIPPDFATGITIDSNAGTAGFNNISIGMGLTYTVGFFPSGWDADPAKRQRTTLACSQTFTQGQPARQR